MDTCPQEPVQRHVCALAVTRGRAGGGAERSATRNCPRCLSPQRAYPCSWLPLQIHKKIHSVWWGENTGKEDGWNGLIFPCRGRSWLHLVSVPYGGSYPEDFHYMTTFSCDSRWKHRPPWNAHTQFPERGIIWIRLHGRTLFSCPPVTWSGTPFPYNCESWHICLLRVGQWIARQWGN